MINIKQTISEHFFEFSPDDRILKNYTKTSKKISSLGILVMFSQKPGI